MFQSKVSVQLQLSAADVALILSGSSPELLCGLRQPWLPDFVFFVIQNFNKRVQPNNIDV